MRWRTHLNSIDVMDGDGKIPPRLICFAIIVSVVVVVVFANECREDDYGSFVGRRVVAAEECAEENIALRNYYHFHIPPWPVRQVSMMLLLHEQEELVVMAVVPVVDMDVVAVVLVSLHL